MRDADVTRRLLLMGHKHPWREALTVLCPVLLAGALACAFALLVHLSSSLLPSLRFTSPGSVADEEEESWWHASNYVDGEQLTTSELLPFAVSVGVLTGVLVFVLSALLGDRMATVFSVIAVGLCALAGIGAIFLLAVFGAPSPAHLSAGATDIFLVLLLPIAVPVVIGALLGWSVATAS